MESEARLNHFALGILAGLVGTGTGFLLLAAWWCTANHQDFSYFVQNVFIASSLYKDSILTVSVLFNVGVFYLALQKDMYRFTRGLMLTMILSVLLIIWIQAQTALGS